MQENENIRKAARVAGVPLWKVAATLGVGEGTLIRWLHFPLPAEKESNIMEAITALGREVSWWQEGKDLI